MPPYAAFLRGVSPMNAKMPELKKCFEAAGFTDVKTVLSSGNVVFSARAASEASLERKAEAAMKDQLGRSFLRKGPVAKLALPIERDGARILSVEGSDVFSAYLPSPRGPVFMTLIEKTFGQEVTTRTWDTIKKVARRSLLLREP